MDESASRDSHRISFVALESEAERDRESEGSLFSIDIDEDSVYVAVGKSESSMEALRWTLKCATPYSTLVHLIHVFPVIRLVPSPRGMLPKSQANSKVVRSYEAQQRDKRDQLLQLYVDACSGARVRVQTIVVENDDAAKTILEIIPSFNITRLVLGSTKSTLRKLKSKRGIGSQIVENAPRCCDVKIICKGKEVIDKPSFTSSCLASRSRNSLSTQDGDNKEPELTSPDPAHSPSNGWNVFKWAQPKPASPSVGFRVPSKLPISSFYKNLLS